MGKKRRQFTRTLYWTKIKTSNQPVVVLSEGQVLGVVSETGVRLGLSDVVRGLSGVVRGRSGVVRGRSGVVRAGSGVVTTTHRPDEGSLWKPEMQSQL